MGAGRDARRKRTRARLAARVRELEYRDELRRLELADTDAALAESRERERRAKELVPALAERIYACHEILALRAERRAVAMTEVDYPTE